MIKFENTEVVGWEHAIRGMRNPMNSWEKSDSIQISAGHCDDLNDFELAQLCGGFAPIIKENDHDLMMRLAKGGPVHAKYRRMIVVYVDLTAPLYWWKEFDTYKVGTVANSCSTMHKIHAKEFTLKDFSCEHLMHAARIDLGHTIDALNFFRNVYLHGGMVKNENGEVCGYGKKSSQIWWQMIQLLPSSYNQKRTVDFNYQTARHMSLAREHHKLSEWSVDFCNMTKKLPYGKELIWIKKENK